MSRRPPPPAPAAPPRIGILLADHHPIVRRALRLWLSTEPDMAVVGEAAGRRAVPELVGRLRPDLVILDVDGPQPGGLEPLRLIRESHARVGLIVYSDGPEEEYAVPIVRAGANAYLDKGGPPELLFEAVRRVAAGANYFTPRVADRLARTLLEPERAPAHERLPERQMQVLLQLARGNAAADVAQQLALSAKTLSTYRRKVLDALGCRTNSELTYYAMKHGLLE